MLGPTGSADEWKASATKVIELRNTIEQPLIVFIPSSLRTAAEDSLDIATFTELSLAGVTKGLGAHLLEAMPQDLRTKVADILEFLRLEKMIRHDDQEVDYLPYGLQERL